MPLKVQFARLLCEIAATQENFDADSVCAGMDMVLSELNEIFEAAHDVWEDFKVNGADNVQ